MIKEAIKIIPSLLKGVKLWSNRIESIAKKQNEMIEAISSIMDAAITTKGYIYDSRELGNVSRTREIELSGKWQIAASRIRIYDERLHESANIKALGWADPREWKKRENEIITVDLDKIIKQCRWHMEKVNRKD